MDAHLKHRRKLWCAINNPKLRTNPKLREKVLAQAITYFAFRVNNIKFSATKKDWEVLAFATEVFCPRLVDINLWALDELDNLIESEKTIRDASKANLEAKAMHSMVEDAVDKYGGKDRKEEWLRIGKKIGRRFAKYATPL